MKLLNCLDCDDILAFKLDWRECACHGSKARYCDDGSVEYVGNARILGIRNDQYDQSLKDRDPKLDYTWFQMEEKPGYIRKRYE